MGVRYGLLAIAMMSACYRGGELNCEVACSLANECPAGQSCGAAGFCAASGVTCQPGGGIADAGPGDGLLDSPPIPDVNGEFCAGTMLFRLCFPTVPDEPNVRVPGFDTDTACTSANFAKVEMIDSREMCLVAAGSIRIEGVQRFTGSRPLVLFGSAEVRVIGTLDVSSSLDKTPAGGAGSLGDCAVGSGLGQAGSGGGGFISVGGRGGDSGDGLDVGAAGGAAVLEASFRGGCPGANSPDGQLGGPGGGAVYLISGTQVAIQGRILAGGGGGRGGAPSDGGAGGGSGGFIGLDAPQVLFSNGSMRLIAAGGGGGGGGCGSGETENGHDPDLNGIASGGVGAGGLGGSGGAGASSSQFNLVDGNNGSGTCAGGGGGGGVGEIRVIQSVPGMCGSVNCYPSPVIGPLP